MPGTATSDFGPQPALVVRNLSKTFGARTVLSAFNLELQPGEIHVLLGQNGSGKSTFIKILSGYHAPDDGGAVLIGGQPLQFGSPVTSYRLGCRFVHQDLALVTGMSVLDNLFINGDYPTRAGTIRRRVARRRAEAALAGVGLDIDPESDVATLQAAERTAVAVARALLAADDVKPHVLVLDEPTATLPANEVDRLLSTLRSVAASGVAIIYVTHHLDEVAEFAHRVSVLRDGRLISTVPIAGMDRQTLVHDMIGAQLEAVERPAQPARRRRSGSPILSVENLDAGPLKGARLDAWAGEITGVCGLTGSGREAVLGAIFGATARGEGAVRVAGELLPPGRPDAAIWTGVAYLSPDRRTGGGIMDMSARDNLTLPDLKPFWRKLNLWSKRETAEAQLWFDAFDVRPRDGVELPLRSFSGGNQQKVLFAKWLRLSPRLLLMDEPTQGVDVGAKAELHRQMLVAAAAGAAVVISSTDLDELATLCDRVLFIRNGTVATELEGAEITPASLRRSFHIGASSVLEAV